MRNTGEEINVRYRIETERKRIKNDLFKRSVDFQEND